METPRIVRARRRVGLTALLTFACIAFSLAAAQELVVAMKAQPPTMDLHVTSDNTVRNIFAHVNEGLFTFDADFQPTPMLAEGYERSDDGQTYTFEIREGVTFHNGTELTAEDVVASLGRWMDRSSFGETLSDYTENLEAAGSHTVVLELTTPVTFVVTALSTWRAGPFIYPAEVIEETGDDRIQNPIGTGPYQFVEWRESQEIVLERYEDYAPVDAEPDGYSGRREAEMETLRFVFIPELSARKVGVEAGDFHMALDVDPDSYDQYVDDPNVDSYLGAPRMTTFIPNKAQGIMADLTMRRAAQAAVCVEQVLPVYGGERFWRVDPSITWQETAWWSDAGADRYNVCDPDRAGELLQEVGYDGAPIRLAVSNADQSKFNVAQVLEQQLEVAGFNIELESRDASAHSAVLDDPARWDFSLSEHTYRTHPILHSHLQATWTGWWESEERDQLLEQFLVADEDEALGVWEEIQELYYQDVVVIKIGDYFEHHIASAELEGYANQPEPFFWNVQLAE